MANWEIYFDECEKIALVGDKFRKDVVNSFRSSKPNAYDKEIAISD